MKTTAKLHVSPASLDGKPCFSQLRHFKGDLVPRTTFQKRQKEMKRLEKQRNKAERREQRKLEKRALAEAGSPESASADATQAETESPLEDQNRQS